MLFDFLFLALAVLLIFSGGIILYSSLFASPETAFLLGTPARADQVFAYKFQAAVAFSSWAFLLLGLPILIAYGLVFGVPWCYYALLPVFFVGFLLLPGSVGALAASWSSTSRRSGASRCWLSCSSSLVSIAAVWWTYRAVRERSATPGRPRRPLQWLDASSPSPAAS